MNTIDHLDEQGLRVLFQLLAHRNGTVDCTREPDLHEDLHALDIVETVLDRPGVLTLREDDREDENGYYVPFRNLRLEVALRNVGLDLYGNGDAGFYVQRKPVA